MHVSDLASGRCNARARKVMSSLNLDNYSLKELSDMAKYLYKREESFANMDEAKQFFKR